VTSWLDGKVRRNALIYSSIQHVVFGTVVEGMDIVKEIERTPTLPGNNNLNLTSEI
jgi:cyclophilin family peptidyl-prolyl cis-trans isomerase